MKFNSFLFASLISFVFGVDQNSQATQCIHDALTRFLRENDFDNQVQEYFRSGNSPAEMLLV